VNQDANWNVTAILNQSGVVQERYMFDPYGAVTFLDQNLVSVTTGATTATYTNDALNRRILEIGASTRDLYFSKAWQVVEEVPPAALVEINPAIRTLGEGILTGRRFVSGLTRMGRRRRLHRHKEANERQSTRGKRPIYTVSSTRPGAT
jgi:hypothetical protein